MVTEANVVEWVTKAWLAGYAGHAQPEPARELVVKQLERCAVVLSMAPLGRRSWHVAREEGSSGCSLVIWSWPVVSIRLRRDARAVDVRLADPIARAWASRLTKLLGPYGVPGDEVDTVSLLRRESRTPKALLAHAAGLDPTDPAVMRRSATALSAAGVCQRIRWALEAAGDQAVPGALALLADLGINVEPPPGHSADTAHVAHVEALLSQVDGARIKDALRGARRRKSPLPRR